MWRLSVFLLCISIMTQCDSFQNNGDKGKMLASAYGNQLYLDDISDQLLPEHNSKDSQQIISKATDSWLMEKIIENESVKLGNKNEDVIKLVDDYRMSLLIHNFEKEYLDKNLNRKVSQAEIDTFFNHNLELFDLKEDIIRFMLMKFPLESDNDTIEDYWEMEDLPALKSLINDINGLALLDFEKWYTISEFKALLPDELYRKINTNRTDSYRLDNEKFKFYVKILEKVRKNDAPPVSFFENNIRERILRNRSRILLKEMKTELFKQKIKNKGIKIYSNTNS